MQVFINRAAIQRVWDANIAQPFLLSFNHCGVFPVAAMSYLNSIRHLCLPEQYGKEQRACHTTNLENL